MKQSGSIFLLVLLLTAQYARQLSYLGCKLYNQLPTSTAYACDCERLVKQTTPAATDYESNTSVHRHLHVDDYVSLLKKEDDYVPVITRTSIPSGQYGEKLTAGFLKKIIKPPQG